MTSTRGDRRRRFAKACDPCRKRKLRCDGIRPVCTRCQGLEDSCHYADVDKPCTRQRRSRGPSQNPPGLSPEQDSLARADTDSLDLQSHPGATLDTPEAVRPQPGRNTQPGTRPMHNLCQSSLDQPSAATNASPLDTIVGGSGDMRYFGPPSGVSLVSIGTSRKPEQSSRHTLQPSPKDGSWTTWTHPSIQSVFGKRTNKSLPPWTEAFSLVSEFFSEEHQTFPCFHPPAFMTLLGQQYSGTCTESPAWWVSLNAVLAIAQRRRTERAQSSSADEDSAWGYAANALGTILDVLMRSTQLLSVQALLSIAWFFIGTPNPQPSFMLIGSALRLAHSIGLHTNNYDSSWSSIELEMRRKVFWIALNLDRELCLRTGRPPAHDLHDFHVDLPVDSLDDLETITTTDGSTMNLFKAQSQLAVIQGCIYRKLHSSEPLAEDTSYIADSVSTLNHQLEEWCTIFAPSFRPDQPLQRGEHHGLMRLYYSYYNCVIVTNRAHGLKYWVPLNLATPLDLPTSIKASIQRCLQAARSIVDLCQVMPCKWKSFYWDVIPIVASAAIILSINVLRDPGLDTTKDDLHAVLKILPFFSALDGGHTDTYLAQIRMACEELYRRAQLASQSFEQQLIVPLQQRGWEGQGPVAVSQRQKGLTGTQPVSGLTMPNTDLLPVLPQEGGDESTFDVEPRSHSIGFNLGGWTNARQTFPYPVLSPWDLDMLSGVPFTSMY